MVFTHDTEAALLAAVALVNSAEEPDTLTTVEELAALPRRARVHRDARPATPPSWPRSAALRPRLRELMTRDRDTAAELVNDLLGEEHALPQLVRHGESRLAHPRGRAGRPTRDPDGRRGGDGDDRRDPRRRDVATRHLRRPRLRGHRPGPLAQPVAAVLQHRLHATAPRSRPTALGSAETVRIAVVGASGKTGRAISASLASRGADVVPVGRREWPTLADSFAGCDAVSIVAPNLHRRRAGPRGRGAGGRGDGRRGPGRLPLGRRAVRPGDAAPPRQGPRRGRRTAIGRSRGRSSSPVPTCRTSSPRCGRARRTSRCPTTWTGRSDWSTSTTSPRRRRGCCWTTAMRVRRTSWAGRTWSRSPTSPWRRARCSGGRSWPGGRTRRPGRRVRARGSQPREREWLAAMFGYYDRHGLPAGGRVLRDLLGGRSTPLAETLTRELTGRD